MALPTVTEDQVFIAMNDFLESIVIEGTEIIKAQVNRTPEPSSENFVLTTAALRSRLATNINIYDIDGEKNAMQQKIQFSMQLDIHGPIGGDNAQVITTYFRSQEGVALFAENDFEIVPLYTSEPKQIPFTNGENQWEDRWVISAEMQINPSVVIDQQFAKTMNVRVIEVDATYPVEQSLEN